MSQHHKQNAKRHKQHIGRNKGKSVCTHILLSLPQSAARKVFLHHILVESGHYNYHESTAKQLFPEVLRRNPVVHNKHTAMLVGSYRLNSIRSRHPQLSHHIIYNKYKGSKHTCSLKRIGPNQGLYAAPSGVQPYQCNHRHNRQGKRHTYCIEHKALQDDAHNVETHGGSRHLGYQEEPRSRLVRAHAEPLLKIGVYGC